MKQKKIDFSDKIRWNSFLIFYPLVLSLSNHKKLIKLKILCGILCFFACVPVHAYSVVYNFRIAQITKQPIDENWQNDYALVNLIFAQWRKKYDGERQFFSGIFDSYMAFFNTYYLRIDGAVSYLKQHPVDSPIFTDIETDDILFTFGKNFKRRHSTLTLSGLMGVPTHEIYRLRHLDIGYSQMSVGGQFDGNLKNTLMFGARYIHFFARRALGPDCAYYRFSAGNLANLLLALRKDFRQHHGFEVGYTNEFSFGAKIWPQLDDTIEKTNYIRTNFYAVYKYRFLVDGVRNRFLLNISYGFDNSPKKYGNKYIIFLWASWITQF